MTIADCNAVVKLDLFKKSSSSFAKLNVMQLFTKDEWQNSKGDLSAAGLLPQGFFQLEYSDARQMLQSIFSVSSTESIAAQSEDILLSYVSPQMASMYSACLAALKDANKLLYAWLPTEGQINSDTRRNVVVRVLWRPQGQDLIEISVDTTGCKTTAKPKSLPLSNSHVDYVFERTKEDDIIVTFRATLKTGDGKTVEISETLTVLYAPEISVEIVDFPTRGYIDVGGGAKNVVEKTFSAQKLAFPYFYKPQHVADHPHTELLKGGPLTTVVTRDNNKWVRDLNTLSGVVAVDWQVGVSGDVRVFIDFIKSQVTVKKNGTYIAGFEPKDPGL